MIIKHFRTLTISVYLLNGPALQKKGVDAKEICIGFTITAHVQNGVHFAQ
jgi:hypothetical protein